MVVGGFTTANTEVIDLSGDGNVCTDKANYPLFVQDAVGFMMEGKPTNCGGKETAAVDGCYQFNVGTNSWELVSLVLKQTTNRCHY